MMNIVLFCVGALGALLTVYIGKQEILPEFRLLFETAEKEKEAIRLRNHIKWTEKHIDMLQDKIEKSISENEWTKLQIVLESSQKELQDERERLKVLEREITQHLFISRFLGFLFYIVLGGVLSALLAGRVKIEGLSDDLSIYVQSFVIGATWMSYLSVIGLNQISKKINEEVETLRSEIQQIVETTETQTQHLHSPLPSRQAAQIYELLDETRTNIRRNIQRIL